MKKNHMRLEHAMGLAIWGGFGFLCKHEAIHLFMELGRSGKIMHRNAKVFRDLLAKQSVYIEEWKK
jgi:hypothetical protein